MHLQNTFRNVIFVILMVVVAYTNAAKIRPKLSSDGVWAMRECKCVYQNDVVIYNFEGCGMAYFTYFKGMVNFADLYNSKIYSFQSQEIQRSVQGNEVYVKIVAGLGNDANFNGTHSCRRFGYFGDGGPALLASFGKITHISVDHVTGDLYITDQGNHSIRMIKKTTGEIFTVAGIGRYASDSIGMGVVATKISLDTPVKSIVVKGSLYIQEKRGILRVAPDDTVSIFIDTKAHFYWAKQFKLLTFDISQKDERCLIAYNLNGNSFIKRFHHENGTFTQVMGIEREDKPQPNWREGYDFIPSTYPLNDVTDMVSTVDDGAVYVIDTYSKNSTSQLPMSVIHRLETDGTLTVLLNSTHAQGPFSNLGVYPTGNSIFYLVTESSVSNFIETRITCPSNINNENNMRLSRDRKECVPICDQRSAEDPKVCSGHGTCQFTGLTEPSTECVCDPGFSNETFCKTPVCESDCSGHGKCVGPNECSCYEGYASKHGENNCKLYVCNGTVSDNTSHVCYGRGACVGVDRCDCIVKDGNLAYSGDNCEHSLCNFKWSYDPTVCNGKGTCFDYDKCTCMDGYTGPNCETHSLMLILTPTAICTLLSICVICLGLLGLSCGGKLIKKLKATAQHYKMKVKEVEMETEHLISNTKEKLYQEIEILKKERDSEIETIKQKKYKEIEAIKQETTKEIEAIKESTKKEIETIKEEEIEKIKLEIEKQKKEKENFMAELIEFERKKEKQDSKRIQPQFVHVESLFHSHPCFKQMSGNPKSYWPKKGVELNNMLVGMKIVRTSNHLVSQLVYEKLMTRKSFFTKLQIAEIFSITKHRHVDEYVIVVLKHYPIGSLSLDTDINILQKIFTIDGLWRACRSMATALAQLHQTEIVHNDFTIPNMVIEENEEKELVFLIIDLDAARPMDRQYFQEKEQLSIGSEDSYAIQKTPEKKFQFTQQGDLYLFGLVLEALILIFKNQDEFDDKIARLEKSILHSNSEDEVQNLNHTIELWKELHPSRDQNKKIIESIEAKLKPIIKKLKNHEYITDYKDEKYLIELFE